MTTALPNVFSADWAMPRHPKEPSFLRSASTRRARFKTEASDVASASPAWASGFIKTIPSPILARMETVAMTIGVRVSLSAKKVAATILTAEKAHRPIA